MEPIVWWAQGGREGPARHGPGFTTTTYTGEPSTSCPVPGPGKDIQKTRPANICINTSHNTPNLALEKPCLIGAAIFSVLIEAAARLPGEACGTNLELEVGQLLCGYSVKRT